GRVRRSGGAHRLDRLVDRGVVGRGVAEEELVYAESEGGEDGRVESPGGTVREEGDRGVGGSPPLDGNRSPALRLGALAAGEAARLGCLPERPLGERPVLEGLAHDRERDLPRLGDLPRHRNVSRFARCASRQRWTLARSALTAWAAGGRGGKR